MVGHLDSEMKKKKRVFISRLAVTKSNYIVILNIFFKKENVLNVKECAIFYLICS